MRDSITIDSNPEGINQYTGAGGNPKDMDKKELKVRHDEEHGNMNWEKQYGTKEKAEEHASNVKILKAELAARGHRGPISSATHNRSDIGQKTRIRKV